MMDTVYLHTQPGWFIRIICFAMILIWVSLAWFNPNKNLKPTLLLGLPVTLTILGLWWSMTVEVTHTELHHHFGFGFWKKSYALSDIQSVSKEQTRWYNGYGIRYVGTGWLYNVSGFDVVHITLTSGESVLLGTDDPDGLLDILSQ